MKIIVNKLPECCQDCLFYGCFKKYGNDLNGCRILNRKYEKDNEKRLSQCPLAPISKYLKDDIAK